jgi:predicted metal-dependent HD superfamily phosphohydrolase
MLDFEKDIPITLFKPTKEDPIYNWLFQAYNEPFRKYHNLNHIKYGLDLINKFSSLFDNKTNVLIAWWFHDCVFTPTSRHSEFESAEKARYFCILKKFLQKDINEIYDLIRYLYIPIKYDDTSKDKQLFHDIDYAILGESKEKYERYKKQIQQEYSFIKKIFTFNRKIFLENVLRAGIYQTEEFKDIYYENAIKNIKRELESYNV